MCGRQSGKSRSMARKLKKLRKDFPDLALKIGITGASERQSLLLFEKVMAEFKHEDIEKIEKVMLGKTFKTQKAKREFEKEYSDFKDPPTMSHFKLKDGFEVICLPSGRTGAFIAGFTFDILIVEEAQSMYEEVWPNILPTLAISEKTKGFGWEWLLGTAGKKKEGYFYDAQSDKDFLFINKSSEDCKRISKKWLKKMKRRMTKADYTRQFLARYVEDDNKYFLSKLIKKRMDFDRYNFKKEYNPAMFWYYLGVDVARWGRDDIIYFVVEINKITNYARFIYFKRERKQAITATIGTCVMLQNIWNFKNIYPDEGGLGGGVVDMLIEKFRSKIVPVDGAKKSIGEKKLAKSAKEFGYSNWLAAMEQEKCSILNDKEIYFSMNGINYDFNSKGDMQISGRKDHICEAMWRAFLGVLNKNQRLFLL